ncbi:MAG TPA: hypothetical protein VFE24_17405 [Pirellulales bacterium]|jgi:thioredoxin reductase|nr:hypothetical protein [Pirellulales bacterium]
MFLDTPARIAIVGAGPVGLEAALYARYLGYEVDLYERGQVAEHLRRWGQLPMLAPFCANRSSLGLAALRAQDENWQPPREEAILSGGEFRAQYLLPLAQSDLLADSVHTGTEVLAIGRDGVLKHETIDPQQRGELPFRLLLRDAQGNERFASAECVLDCSGVLGSPNGLGEGGLPALGERAAAEQIEYGQPDVLNRDREQYARKQTLVIGANDAAAATVTALADLAHQAPGTWITWITREERSSAEPGETPSGPVPFDPADPSPARAKRAQAANRLTSGDADHVTYWPGTSVESVHWNAGLSAFEVRLQGEHPAELRVERIVAHVGHHPDVRLFDELPVELSPQSDGPSSLAMALATCSTPAEIHDFQLRAEHLETSEPYFFVLGAKSFGRRAGFTPAHGFTQIRRLFALFGDRDRLDLYSTAASQAAPTPSA